MHHIPVACSKVVNWVTLAVEQGSLGRHNLEILSEKSLCSRPYRASAHFNRIEYYLAMLQAMLQAAHNANNQQPRGYIHTLHRTLQN